MTHEARRIGALVVRMQQDFIDAPNLTLTPQKARERFRVDLATCEAVLDALVEARVLARTARGGYTRFVPRRSNGTSPDGSGRAENRAAA
jgi:hypothetical protein